MRIEFVWKVKREFSVERGGKGKLDCFDCGNIFFLFELQLNCSPTYSNKRFPVTQTEIAAENYH